MDWAVVLKKLFSYSLEKFHERRNHTRFEIWDTFLANVKPEDDCDVELVNISYGGVGLRLSSDEIQEWSDLPKEMVLTLNVLDESVKIQASRTHVAGRNAGFQFHHTSLDSLLLLRSVTENLRRGASITIEDKASFDSNLEAGQWVELKGDDDLLLRFRIRPQTNEVADLHLEFLDNNIFHTFAYDGKNVRTFSGLPEKKAELTTSVSPAKFEKPVVRMAIFIFMGIDYLKVRKILSDVLCASAKCLDINVNEEIISEMLINF